MNTKSRGPGPGAYKLPPNVGFANHDVRKLRKPQYSFGRQFQQSYQTIGPGPAAYNINKLTKYGKDGTPHFTIRPKTHVKAASKSPGPGSNEVHTKPFWNGPRAPAFSIQSKHYAISEKVESPSSNTYYVQDQVIKPKPPIYSLGKLLPKKLSVDSPGPATYGRVDLSVKLKKYPAFSITGRNVYSFKPCGTASTKYDLSYYHPGPTRPAYSFGNRHSDYAPPMILPCDNLY